MQETERIHLPSGLKKVGTQAFYFCPLTDQPFPESLEFIAEAAFFRCAFTSVVLPRSVTYIGDHAFHGSNTLKYLEFHHDPDFIGADIANKITVIRCYEGSKVDTYCKEYGYQTEYL
ncbi:MAG: leucine-rich repeat domain-containing protein [Lachnospiraceae bacterium]